jgi:hypothetical protein
MTHKVGALGSASPIFFRGIALAKLADRLAPLLIVPRPPR